MAEKTAKSYTKTLHGEQSRLIFVAVVSKVGATSYVLHQVKDGDKWKTEARGATESHPDITAASKAVDAGVTAALKGGWRKPAGPAGFKPKPDAFSLSNLPPAKPKK
jgi:hypothetical protein